MGKVWERTKTVFELAEHGKLLVKVLGSLAVGKAIQAGLVTWTHIPSIWVTPIWLLAAAVFFWLLTLISKRMKRSEPAETQITIPPTPPEQQFADVDNFYKTYDNALLLETEALVKTGAEKFKPGNDRERFLVRTLASGAISHTFDVVWYTIYNSQLRLLDAFNSTPPSTAESQKYYEQASQNYPIPYLTYPFDQWLSYLHVWLMTVQNGDTLAISVRGREFLKYLVQQGRSANDRPL